MDFDLPFGISEGTAEAIRNLAFGLYSVYENSHDDDLITMGQFVRESIGRKIDEEERLLELDG